ncbi:MAG TPA: uroporphyrinogen decarboxylase family protein [Candidatus Latescibacteria bacterium]|nr:uroporphyrinogen decarboxylase family protein [Candidatus Latescibacterota bacterium]HJP31289.1 uroporphyrinogen decarboxylase family protein [Candidatus Latescibacterota bacterium]
MTSIERMANTLARKPVDRTPIAVSPWGATVERWRGEGHLKPDENVAEHFDQDLCSGGWLDSTVDLDFEAVTLEETEETILQLDGNGARLRRHKLHDSTPEHVGFEVIDRETWEDFARPRLVEFDRRRIPFEAYRQARSVAAERQRFFCWAGVAPFEQMHPLCGHENMLAGMALDPDWVKDMVQTYADLTLRHLEVLVAEEGKPDAFFFYEDMGLKARPFMSPAMYREIIQPGHQQLFDFAHAQGCRVIVHSCGYVEPLVPGLIEAGMDCLQAMEVKAGMDLPTLYSRFGDQIAFYGGIDVRTLISNDRAAIDAEMDTKILPVVTGGGGYVLHSDHSEPPEVDYETMCYFVERGRALGRWLLPRQ